MTLELWSAEPRALRAGNLGPLRGDHHIGTVDGPGVYFLVAPNAGGKTTEVRLLESIQDQERLKSSAWIHRGADSAYLELEPFRVTFTRSPAGEVRVESEGAAEMAGRITSMPPSIETLIHGDHLDGDDARARRRLEALLTYAPVQATPERLDTLLGAFAGSSIQAEISTERDERTEWESFQHVWQRLADEAAQGRRLRFEPLRSVAGIREWIMTNPKRGTGVLDDHGLLRDIANATANVGEKAAEVQRRRIAKLEGALEETMDSAREKLTEAGMELPEGEDAFRGMLEGEYATETVTALVEERRSILTRLEQSHADRQAAERRQERLKESHGDRPEYGDEEAVTLFRHQLSLLSGKAEAVAGFAMDEPGFLENDGYPRELDRLRDDTVAARERLSSLREARATKREEQARWDAVEAEINFPIEGATAEEVETARSGLKAAERDLSLAEWAARFQETSLELEQALDLARRIDEVAKDLRSAAKDSWAFLGKIITDSLRLPWLQVDGLDIYLGYVDGRLNADPELIAEAERAAEQAAAALDNLSPVALPRFIFERIREASAVEWRLLDDEVNVSTAELHESCLTLMLERRGELSEIIIVDWKIPAALDSERLLRFDRQVREAGKVLISERPRDSVRDRDAPAGLFLERVADRAEVAS